MTTVRPAARAFSAAASLITPSCIHNTFAPTANRLVDRGHHLIGATKDVDDFDFLRHVFQFRVAFLAQHFPFVRIHRNDAVAGALQIFSDTIARPRRVRTTNRRPRSSCIFSEFRRWDPS